MKKAVVLLSGGIDSSTTAAIAKAEGYEIYALSFDYAQRHKIELESAKKVAESLGAKKYLVIKFDLREIGGSALTSEIEVPKDNTGTVQILRLHSTPSVNQGQSPIPITYVPARNTIFLSFALSWAETLEAPDIFIGANAVDYSGYPDCRPEYLKAFEDMANLATKVSVEGKIKFRINAPLLYMTKADIIRKGMELGFDYSLTWSCYDPQNSAKRQAPSAKRSTLNTRRSTLIPCGKCDSCIFRAKGFQEAGINDPL
ncbi:MAG: 7-cyano-7-deazaguanine synthase QueC [Nitrospirae bacterium]|nr:7-cyano-7-deazaguanine synthase QueC [Nitrospirota bacterium]